MNLPLLRLAAVATIATISLCLASCEHYKRSFAGPNPAPGTVMKWPGAAFDEVRAYCYDYTKERTSRFLDLSNGRMHPGVMDPHGVKLSTEQAKRLVSLITISQPKGKRTACYAPHHAFVFFSEGRPVAVFEMCFGCNRQRSYPGDTPEYVNREGLWDLTGELGLPLGVGNRFYSEACKSLRVR